MMEDRRGDFVCVNCGARERDCPGDCDTGYRPRDGSRGDLTRHGFGVIDTPTPRYVEPRSLRERWAVEWSPTGDRRKDQIYWQVSEILVRRRGLLPR